jgi:hypothetical protein
MNSVLQVHKPYINSFHFCWAQHWSFISQFTTALCSYFLSGSYTVLYQCASRIHFYNFRTELCSSQAATIPFLPCSFPLSLSYTHTVASPQLSLQLSTCLICQFSHFSNTPLFSGWSILEHCRIAFLALSVRDKLTPVRVTLDTSRIIMLLGTASTSYHILTCEIYKKINFHHHLMLHKIENKTVKYVSSRTKIFSSNT